MVMSVSFTCLRRREWHVWNPEEILSQKYVLFRQKKRFCPYLASCSSKVKLDDVIGSNNHHHRYLRAKWLRKHVSHGMFVTFIFSDPL